jgi:sigma-B regulation protein RsbU (phosphoserine phosphatase)
VPVIFISSHDDTSTKLKGFEVGGVDYVTKPIVKAELLARVTTHLRLKQAYDMLVDLQAERIKRLSTVQESLMPRPADLPNASFAVVLDQMNQAGGDFYDVIPVGDEIVDYLVADVSGHDLGSSFWTSAIKTLLAEYATPANTPLDIVHAMNRVLSRILPDGVFFTLTYVRLNRRGRRMGVLVAGHPPPLMVSQAEAAHYLTAESDVVGVFSDATFQFRECQVTRGDRLYLYSDGLVELEPGRDGEEARLTTLGEKARELPLDTAVTTIRQEMVGGRVPSDDILLLGIEV